MERLRTCHDDSILHLTVLSKGTVKVISGCLPAKVANEQLVAITTTTAATACVINGSSIT
jgi:hypothetical protein